ncbi:MAG TPA: hypothetical protein QF611_18085 [Pseudomonadales bacterium]|nr:hypothetical protein [Pseudomonadales bacterium]
MKYLALALTLLLSNLVIADNHSPLIPVEVWQCSLNEGKTMEDIRRVSKAVGAWSTAQGIKDAQWILTPFSGDIADPGRFILMTGWADLAEMGKAFQGFFGDGAGDSAEVFADFTATASCDTRNLWMVESTYDRLEE